jgi:hypothetical protein
MELYIYDTTLTLKGVIDEMTSFIWIRRYWSAGEFKLLVPFTELNGKLLVKNNLIMKKGDNEAAQITYITIKKNAYGQEEIEVQGKFITAWLDKRILLKQIVTTDTSQSILNRIVTENLTNPTAAERVIPLLELEESPQDLGSGIINYTSEPFISSLFAAETLAKAAKLGFEIQTDIRNQKHIFRVYKGRDLTADQTTYRPCIFSQEFDNIYEQEYENSIENLRSACYVGGEEKEGVERQIVAVGTASGLERKEIFVNATDITQTYKDGDTEIIMPLSEYIERLRDRGVSELEQYAETLNFSSKVNVYGNLEYKTDFDIGDRVTCVDKRWGIKINVRITEITETYQQNSNDVDVTFGESLPTLFEKINKMR